ncbi:unnamed protein product [Trichobilharzia szidati]|nr:unnamed protein product [Trichobilharzia szidati]
MEKLGPKYYGILHGILLIVILMRNIECQVDTTDEPKMNESSLNDNAKTTSPGPTLAMSLGYGFLCVTLVNLSALLGVIFTLLKKYRFFPTLLSFMVATAVGSLLSTSIIVLIPEALELVGNSNESHPLGTNWYLPKAISVCAGVLFFYILEYMLRLLPYCFKDKELKSNKQNGVDMEHIHDHHHHHHNYGSYNHRKTPTVIAIECAGDGDKTDPVVNNSTPNHHHHNQLKPTNKSQKAGDVISVHCETSNEDGMNYLPTYDELSTDLSKPVNGEGLNLDSSIDFLSHTKEERKTWAQRIRDLEPVGWMIFIGDGAHNFMDGLSIGVGFSQSIGLGISLTLAVLCEEIPHELGDIAVLLRSGLTVPLAMAFNFASACTAYIGFFIGISVGELSDVAPYVFAVTAGFFLYIALADMLPEMRAMEDAKKAESGSGWGIFFTNLLGLMFGFGCIVTITFTSQYINIG